MSSAPSAQQRIDLRIALKSVIHDACLLRGDPIGNDEALFQEVTLTLSFAQQQEVLSHFRAERARWLVATGQPESFSQSAGQPGTT